MCACLVSDYSVEAGFSEISPMSEISIEHCKVSDVVPNKELAKWILELSIKSLITIPDIIKSSV
jgi:hypothetical protein